MQGAEEDIHIFLEKFFTDIAPYVIKARDVYQYFLNQERCVYSIQASQINHFLENQPEPKVVDEEHIQNILQQVEILEHILEDAYNPSITKTIEDLKRQINDMSKRPSDLFENHELLCGLCVVVDDPQNLISQCQQITLDEVEKLKQEYEKYFQEVESIYEHDTYIV